MTSSLLVVSAAFFVVSGALLDVSIVLFGACQWCLSLVSGAWRLSVVPGACQWCLALVSGAGRLSVVPGAFSVMCSALWVMPDTLLAMFFQIRWVHCE